MHAFDSVDKTRYYKTALPNLQAVNFPSFQDNEVFNFSTSDYYIIPNGQKLNQANSWEMKLKFRNPILEGTNVLFTTYTGSYSGLIFHYNTSANELELYISSNGSSWDIASDITFINAPLTNTTYYIKAEFTGNQYKFSYSLDDINYTDPIIINSSARVICSDCLYLGYRTAYTDQWFRGYIDLSESYIKLDGKMWWQGLRGTDAPYKVTNVAIKGDDIDLGNGIYGNFSGSKYVTLKDWFNPSVIEDGVRVDKPWEIVVKFTTGSDVSTFQPIFSQRRYSDYSGVMPSINGPALRQLISYTGSAWSIDSTTSYNVEANTTYWLKEQFTGTAYIMSISTDRETYTEISNIASTTPVTLLPERFNFGWRHYSSYYFSHY